MIKLIFLNIVILISGCASHNTEKNIENSQISTKGEKGNYELINDPIIVIKQYYEGIQHHDLKLIANSFGRKDTSNFNTFITPNIKYIIIKKELITQNDPPRKFEGDYFITIKEIYDQVDTSIVRFIVRKIEDRWIIIAYSSSVQDKMDQDIRDLPN
jgi:hypothetical protein